jgi:hypothetical protein
MASTQVRQAPGCLKNITLLRPLNKKTPAPGGGRELHKNLFLAIYAFISRKNTKAKESAADRVISNRLVKLKVF